MHRIRCDLETFGKEPNRSDFAADRSKIKIPGSMKKQETIDAHIEKEFQKMILNEDVEFDKAWRKGATDILYAQVICAGFKLDDNRTRCSAFREERFNIKELNKLCRDLGSEQRILEWVTWNGTNFDIPILTSRALLYGYNDLYNALPKSSRDKRNIDLMNYVTPTIWKPYWSLEEICRYVGISVKDDGITGKTVHDHFLKGNIKGIRKYCIKDVQALFKLEAKFNLDYTIRGEHHKYR